MRRRNEPRNLLRSTRFETFEEKLALSGQPVGEFLPEAHSDQQLEHHYGDLAPAEAVAPSGDFNLNLGVTKPVDNAWGNVQTQLGVAHDLTGVNDIYHKYGFDGAGQTVAIIDSGIAYDHEALGGGFGTSYRVVGGWDFAENDANPYDDGPGGFHGTHVAGIVGSDDATNRGVVSGADLVALRVFDDYGAGYFSWVEDALKWVHDNRDAFENPITTVNLSLGTSWNADAIPNWATLEDEFAQLEQDGIFVAVSAGNSFEDHDAPGLSYPAASPHVIPVASVDDTGLLSYFSQRSDRVLAAPGSSITSTVPDYIFGADGNLNDFGTASGTSMAAPYAAGASVLVRQAMEFAGIEDITQATIYDHLRETANVFFDTATNASYHRINVRSALDALIPVDDFGSTVETAHSLGAVRTETSVAGVIGTLNDVDYFKFTASETGSATLTVKATQDLVAEINWLGGRAEAHGDTITFDVVSGEQYTVSLRSGDGLGSYDLQVAIEPLAASAPPVSEPPDTEPPTSKPLPVGPLPPAAAPPSSDVPAPELILDAEALLNSTTWNGSEALARAARHGGFVGDELVSVDLTGSYQLSGWVRSGDDAGGQYLTDNLQFFGFASYDIDGEVILPQHVLKVEGATDTRLANPLRPGDMQIVLEDASGWSNDGADHQRSFAWYGYSDGTGRTYEDYTYTRNLMYKDVWDLGAIDYETNTITLRTAWEGPTIVAGTAARNASSGGTYNYAALVGSVSNEWTQYEATIRGVSSTDANSFRPGTAFIKPLVLTNYHGHDGNLVTWRDVEVRSDASFTAGGQIDLSVASLDLTNVTYAWTQLAGPEVQILNAHTATASFIAPNLSDAYDLSFQVTASAAGVTVSDTVTLGISGNESLLDAGEALDATTWSGSTSLAETTPNGAFSGDGLVSIDVAGSYQLSGWARSGDDAGGQYQTDNLQFFGFASYDIDGEVILPQHVLKVEGATDTRLANPLRPGDMQIVLEDASGWSNDGADHQRSFAWYGYSDGTGRTYEDYTYTRNLMYKDVWDLGAIDYETNTITLRTAWEGPTIVAGTAARNASSGGTYNYAALVGSVPNEWTQYEATIRGVSSTDANSFRPGTAFIKPLVLTNYHGHDGNLVTWRDVEVRSDASFTAGGQIDPTVANLDVPIVTYARTRLAGSALETLNENNASASFAVPLQREDFDLSFQISINADNGPVMDSAADQQVSRLRVLDSEFHDMVAMDAEADLQVGPRQADDEMAAAPVAFDTDESLELTALDQVFSRLDRLFE